MYYIGKIDREIYKCISEHIVTDDVIITDERIEHIKERHPNDYERYFGYLKEIVENPQYIIESNKPNTAFILSEFMEGEEYFKTILRLTTSTDNPEYKNSIITYMKINDKEWKRVLKNKKLFTVEIKNDIILIEYKRSCLRWKISYPSTRRWLDRGNPRDAGERYACQTAS